MTKFAILLIFVCSQIVGQTSINFRPENMIGNRSYNYRHIINVKISEKVRLKNFSYFDCDYNGSINIYNFRNTGSYVFHKKLSANIAVGLKNPGFYTTASVQLNQSNGSISYVILTGLSYLNGIGYALENFGSIRYSPKINNKIKALLLATYAFNHNMEGAIRGIQQFRLGITRNNLSYGIGSNFDQFNYNAKTLQNHGFFTIIAF